MLAFVFFVALLGVLILCAAIFQFELPTLPKWLAVVVLVALAIVFYATFVPQKRYERWGSEFSQRYVVAALRPALVEVVAYGAAFVFLFGSAAIYWWNS